MNLRSPLNYSMTSSLGAQNLVPIYGGGSPTNTFVTVGLRVAALKLLSTAQIHH